MVNVVFNEKRLKTAIEKYGESVLRRFSADTFKHIVKTSPQKDTFSASGSYRRTGTLRDGWDLKKTSFGFRILNETSYAPYYEYGHRLPGGGVMKGNYLMKKSVEKTLKIYGLTARKAGL